MSDRYPIERRPASSPVRTFERSGSGPGLGREARSDFQRYREILARRSKTVIWIFTVVVAAGVAGTLLQEPVYRATGLLEIRTPVTGAAPAEALAAPERVSAEVLATERGLLQSPTLARRVISDLELFHLEPFRPTDGNGGSGWTGDAGELDLRGATASFLGRLIVRPEPDSRLVEVSFEFEDPEWAARIVNATLESYTAMRLESARRAVDWLDAQLDSLRAELEGSEERLRAYAEEHELPHVVDEDLSPRMRDRLRSLQEDLAAAEARRYEAESLFNLVVQGGDFEAAEDAVAAQLAVRLSELRRDYARVSSIFTDDYPEVRQLRRQIEEIERLLDRERGRIGRSIESRYQLALRQESALRSELEQERAALDALMERSGSYHLLRNEVLANRELFASLQRSRGEARISSTLEAAGIGIVDRALPPSSPHRPVMAYNLALALLAGMVLGVGGAFLREFFDDTVRTGQELGLRQDVPVLAMIPSTPSVGPLAHGTRRGSLQGLWPRIDRLAEAGDDDEMLAEALGILRTAVLFHQNGRSPRSVLVSSSQPGEGKTTVGLNLALSLRRLGRRVLLLDADLRRSGLSRAAGVSTDPGLADHLREGRGWRDLVRHDRRDPGLHILSSGGPASDAAELLSLPQMRRLLREAEEEYDLVIVDAPALFVNAPDGQILAELVSGVLIVARSERTSSSLLSQVLETTPNILGIVLNDLDVRRLPPQYRKFFTPYGNGVRGNDRGHSPKLGGEGREGAGDAPRGAAATDTRLVRADSPTGWGA